MGSTHEEISKKIPEPSAEPTKTLPATSLASSTPAVRPSSRGRKWLLILGFIGALLAAGYYLAPTVEVMLNTVSTDDAYVNGHFTFVAPRVSGQVTRVLVDDNYRVKKGALLVQLDKEPFEDQVELKKAAVKTAEADLVAAQAEARGLAAQVRADRFRLERAIEDVHTELANLRANIATLKSREASLELARNNLRRAEELAPSGGISKEELDQRREAVKVADASADQAREAVFATRVGLGLPAEPPKGHDLAEVPNDIDQNFSAIRQALGQVIHSVALLGYTPPLWDATPNQARDMFLKQDPQGNLEHIYASLIPQAPGIKRAEAKLLQARRDLVLAELDRRYCDVVSEIDGVVTRRNVNPGNNVQAGQSLMVVRSLTEIWIDANFKETQLADLRIGHRVRCEVDMYGKRREYEGRITGFTMGTGQTLALLPPQNATGNFVKIVQRLPVRVELTDYDPDKAPLFVGLSVVPYVYFKEPPAGPHAGEVLQPIFPLPQGPTVSSAADPSPVQTKEPPK